MLTETYYKQMTDLEHSLKLLRSTQTKEIYCDPTKTVAAIATIGNICPGMNTVLRSAVLSLEHEYNVQTIFVVKWGFTGLERGDFKKTTAAELEGI